MQIVPNLSKTHIAKKRHSPPSVTLHQMHTRKIECRLNYSKSFGFRVQGFVTCFEKVLSGPHQMPTLGAEPTGAKPNRAKPSDGDRGPPIARSRKISFAKKGERLVYTKCSFVWSHFLRRGKCVGHSILPRSCTLQRESRLRKTHLFNKMHAPTSVSSTPNAHFENQVSSGYTECSFL